MLEQLTEHCWVLPGDNARTRPWLGAIVTREATLVVDAGNSPAHAHELQAALAVIGASPVRALLITHHHWDHHFGACAFPPGTPLIAHEAAQGHMQVMAQEPWSREYLARLAEERPGYARVARAIQAAVADFDSFWALPATVTFEFEWRVSFGGVDVHFYNVGGPHEPDSSVVHVLPDNVLYAGDAPYGRGPRSTWDETATLAMLRRLHDVGADWYVEGHRAPQRATDLRRRIERGSERLRGNAT